MEFLLAVLIFSLAAGGLGLGLALGRAAPKSCSGQSCAAGSACAGCPRRKASEGEG